MTEEKIWALVQGIGIEGPQMRQLVSDLVDGKLIGEARNDVCAALVCDSQASTAGYAALPALLSGGKSDQERWEFACLVAEILAQGVLRKSTPIPDFLADRVSNSTFRIASDRLRIGIASAQLNLADILYSVSLLAAMEGKQDLADDLTRLMLLEQGVGREVVDLCFPE